MAVLIANTGISLRAAISSAPSRNEMWLTTTSTLAPGLMIAACSMPSHLVAVAQPQEQVEDQLEERGCGASGGVLGARAGASRRRRTG